MEPRIRYAKTRDGTAVAFWTYGDGPVMLHLPWLPWGHIQLEYRNPELRVWYDRLAAICELVRYDGRGSGLSDRAADDYGVEGQLSDIEAVAAQIKQRPFALFASLNMGPAALLYVSRNPGIVSHLILWCTYARSEDYNQSVAVNAIRDLMLRDWELYTETGAHAFVGWSAGDAAHQLAELMRAGTTQEGAQRFYDAMRYVDCTALLPEIQVPTLVIHPRQFPLIDVALARGLASAIPDCRFILFEGTSLTPTRGDLDGVVGAIADFLNEGSHEAGVRPTDMRPLKTVGAASLEGLSAREVEVLRLVAGGLSNRDIAETLVLSPRTVERHVANIYGKLSVNNRTQAAAFAISNDLV